MITITKKMEIEMCHRLHDHGGKRKNPHGHTYKNEVTLAKIYEDKKNMVLDFGDLKEIMEATVGTWDHKMLLHADDPLVEQLIQMDWGEGGLEVVPWMPTAENMARETGQMIQLLLPTDVTLKKVRIWETSNSFATYYGSVQ